MGRKKLHYRKFLIGLDKYQAEDLMRLSNLLNYSYSEVMSSALEFYKDSLFK